VRVCPVGEVDVATVDEIRAYLKRLKASSFTRVILDLRGVTFLDAQGVRLILEADASSRADGWSFALIAGPRNVQRVFDLTRLRARLRFVDATTSPGSW
jgi:anti-sigma B factor antagonist